MSLASQIYYHILLKLVVYNYMLLVHLLHLYVCRSTVSVIVMTFLLGVQVHSQDKEPNTKVTGRIILLLHVLHTQTAS